MSILHTDVSEFFNDSYETIEQVFSSLDGYNLNFEFFRKNLHLFIPINRITVELNKINSILSYGLTDMNTDNFVDISSYVEKNLTGDNYEEGKFRDIDVKLMDLSSMCKLHGYAHSFDSSYETYFMLVLKYVAHIDDLNCMHDYPDINFS